MALASDDRNGHRVRQWPLSRRGEKPAMNTQRSTDLKRKLAAAAALATVLTIFGLMWTPMAQGQESGTHGKPTNLTGTVTHDSVTFSWDAPENSTATGDQILHLRQGVDELGAFNGHLDDSGNTETSYTDTDVAAGVRYMHRVTERNGDLFIERSNYFGARLPVVPEPEEEERKPLSAPRLTAVTVDNVTQTGATVTVDISNADDTPVYLQYKFERASSWSDPTSQTAVPGADSVTFSLTNLSVGRSYYVRASLDSGISDDTTNVTGRFQTLKSPSLRDVSFSDITQTGVTVTVKILNANNTRVYMRYKKTSNRPWRNVASKTAALGVSSVTFNLSNLSQSTYYHVDASLTADFSYDNSVRVVLTLGPPKLHSVGVYNIENTSADVDVKVLNPNDTTVYLQYRKSGGAWTDATSLTAAPSRTRTTRFNLTSLDPGTRYFVRASLSSPVTNTTTNVTEDFETPVAPTLGTVTISNITVSSATVVVEVLNVHFNRVYLQYKKSSESSWTDATLRLTGVGYSSSIDYNLTMLAPSTRYDLRASLTSPVTDSTTNKTANFETLAATSVSLGSLSHTKSSYTNVTQTSANVTIGISNANNTPVYLQYKQETDSSWSDATPQTAPPGSVHVTFRLSNLTRSSRYSVRASLDSGISDDTANVSGLFLTLGNPRMSRLQLSNVASSTATVTAVIVEASNTPVYLVYLQYRKSSENAWTDATPRSTGVGYSSSIDFNLTMLAPSTTYKVRASLNSEISDSTSNKTTIFTTLGPPILERVRVNNVTSNAATVTAVIINADDTPVYAQYKKSSDNYWTDLPSQTASGPGSVSFSLTDLSPITSYNVRASLNSPITATTNNVTRDFGTRLAPAIGTVSFNDITWNSAKVTVGISNADYTAVYLQYKRETDNSWTDAQTQTARWDDSNVSFSLMNLTQSTKYDVRASLTSPITDSTTNKSATFETPTTSLSLGTVSASNVTQTGADVTVTISNADNTPVYLQYREWDDNSWVDATSQTAAPGDGSVTFRLSNLSVNGRYYVRASLDSGISDDTTNVTGRFRTLKSTSLGDVTFIDITQTGITVTVDILSPNNTPVYLQYRKTGDTTWTDVASQTVEKDGRREINFSLTNLTEGTTYNVRASLTSPITDTTTNVTNDFTTRLHPVLGTVSVSGITQTDATVAVGISNAGHVPMYLQYKKSFESTWTDAPSQTAGRTQLFVFFNLSNLTPGTEYNVRASLSSPVSDSTTNVTGSFTTTGTRTTPPSTDATLSGLTLSGIDFGTFASGTESYTASVANNVSQTTVTPTVTDSGASYVIKIGGVEDADGTVSLAVGSNVITVEVTAEDDSTTKTYTVTVTRAAPPSSDATLKALSLSDVSIGAFNSVTTSYTAQVDNSVSVTTVSPTVNHSGASYVIKLDGVTDSDGVIPLSVGKNVITIEVTAEDENTTGKYTVKVTRAGPPSTDATLRGLTLSGISFGTFSSGTTSYTAQVANTVSQTTVSPTVTDSGASSVIKLGGVTDADGTVSLSVGSNVITVEVTAEDESTTRTYIVTVTRAAPPSTDATLKALTMSGIDFGTFDSTTLSYTASVTNSVSQTTVTPTVSDSGARYVIKLGGVTDADGTVSLTVSENVITIVVTAEDKSTTRTYEVAVTRAAPPSTDAMLSNLILSGIDFGTFASGTESYTASVANSVAQTTVIPTVNDSGATYVIKLGGVIDADGTVSLAVSSNIITVEVTAEDGTTTRTYTVTVTRAAPSTPEQLSRDAALSSLTLSGIDFGTFDSTTVSYSAQVANSISQTTVTPTTNDSDASYVIKLGGMEDADGTVTLTVGSNVITVEVTAEDESTTRTYSVTVTRADPPSTDATLSALTLSGVNFGTFASGTESYTASVTNSVTQTTVSPTVNDTEASYVIKLGGVADSDGTVTLAVGGNVITVEVTAEDDTTTKTYTVTVTRSTPPSTDATLGFLTLSGVDFGTFDPTTTSYTAQVANSVSQTTVTPTVDHSGASYVIKLGGVTDADGMVALAVGSNLITVRVTAQDGRTTRTYTVTVTRASQDETPPHSDDPVTGELPTDDPRVNFRVSGYAHDWIDIAWAVPQNRDITRYVVQRYEHSGDGFVSSGSGEGSRFTGTTKGGDSHSLRNTHVEPDTLHQYVLELKDDGDTTIIESSATVRTLSSDAALSALSLSGIDFGTFDRATADYTAEVASDVSRTTVTATANHSGASYVIKLGGVEAADGVLSLEVGENVITVEVTAEDGATTVTYTVTVTREEPYLLTGELPSDDPPVNVRITGYYDDEVSLAWEIPHNRGITSYVLERYDHDGTQFTLSDWSASGSVTGGSGVTESGTGLTADSLFRYDLALKSDAGTVIIEKSLEVQTLKAGATALSADAALSALSLSGVELGPAFSSETYRYTGSVSSDTAQTTVKAAVNDAAASYTVKLGGTVDAAAMLGLSPGRNVITVHVTAEDRVTTGVYTVVVSRAKIAEALSTDASLRFLSLSGIDLGTFDTATTSYTAEVAHDLSQVMVMPVRSDVEATHVIKLDGVEDTDGEISLAVGENVITVEVTAEDGSTTRTYTVTLTRAEATTPGPAPVETCVQSVEADGTVEGTWNDSCLSENEAPGGAGDRYARFYTFTLDEAADIVISLSSARDTYLYVLEGHGKNGDTLHYHDDIASGGVNTNSRLSVTLQPSSYTIEATTYRPATAGDFTLTIQGLGQTDESETEPEADTCIETVDSDGTIEGTWDDTCLSDKAAKHGTGDRYARFYTFTLNEPADVTITLESDEDTYFYLLEGHGRSGTILYEEDDIVYGVNTNSRLSENLPAGDYTIETTTYYAQTEGDFTLTIAGLSSSP